MKIKLLIPLFGTLITLNSYAITYSVIGPCSETAVYSGTKDVDDLNTSVGKISVSIFDQQKIPYQGSLAGFNSIINTPTGKSSIEVISETKMRAYGWCFSVNGTIPDVMPADLKFSSNDDNLIWFYAYSTYNNGVWEDYCVPSYQIKAAQFCSK